MSLSVLYHALGVYGYHNLKTESQGRLAHFHWTERRVYCIKILVWQQYHTN